MAKPVETPMMKQYNEIKAQYPDAVLLFRVGDFYETFSDDAIRASEILGITLTRRANGAAQYVELAGFPHHALDTYLPKLVRANLRVAICDQLEDPKTVKGIVKRGITELITPGVSTNDNIIAVKENNFLAAIHIKNKIYGVSFLDISTGEFLVAEGNEEYVEKLLNSFSPKEVICERGLKGDISSKFPVKFLIQELDDWVFTAQSSNDKLYKHFEVKNFKGFGIETLTVATIAAGAILYYLEHTHHYQVKHISKIARIEEDRYVWLDRFTMRNLELLQTNFEDARSFCNVIDRTTTPMGARMLRRWISFPLKDVKQIRERQNIVTSFFRETEMRDVVAQELFEIGDLERIVSKVAVGRITPREMSALKNALLAMKPIKEVCAGSDNSSLKMLAERINTCDSLSHLIGATLSDNPPIFVNKGNVIATGFNTELDELRDIAFHGKDFLMKIQERESELTGISSLKIGYNNVFGYYIEVRNTHKDKVPEEWIRKQTLVNAERYITQELKEYEEKILGAEDKILILETRLFNELVQSVMEYISVIQANCNAISQLDCLLGFAIVASENRYNCPIVNDDDVIDIKEGRHPVIEKQLPIDEEYVPNSVFLDTTSQQVIMITGPNMSGKSALLRQTALIVLMAQIGSYVPAESALIGVVDKIFTRVGANDNISAGDSTFMVEMNEAAAILNNLSSKSLVLFDELGRGTSTYDGISIAWAIVEYIHEKVGCQARTLFATHYHELNEMEKSYERIKNYNVSVKELEKRVVFLRKLARGGSEHSFGIHVAKMAGMPKSVVKRSNEILTQLEKNSNREHIAKDLDQAPQREGLQLTMFQLDDPVLKQIRDEIIGTDINNLTPIEALNKLSEIKKIITGRG